MIFMDGPALSLQIERHLLGNTGWVPAATIVQAFGLTDERELRATGEKPGLCTEFAISSTRGFRHVRCCTQPEFDAFYSRMRSHGIAELVRAARLRRVRSNVVNGNTSVVDGQLIADAVAPFVPTTEEVQS